MQAEWKLDLREVIKHLSQNNPADPGCLPTIFFHDDRWGWCQADVATLSTTEITWPTDMVISCDATAKMVDNFHYSESQIANLVAFGAAAGHDVGLLEIANLRSVGIVVTLAELKAFGFV